MMKVSRSRKNMILLILLIVSIGLFAMPVSTVTAETVKYNVLRISQEVREESGRFDRDDYTFKYRLYAEESDCPIPEGGSGMGWDFELTGDSSIDLELLVYGDRASSGTVPIRFGSVGTYHYILEQTEVGKLGYVTYDRSVYDIYVKVAMTGKYRLRIDAVWAQRDTGEKPGSLAFVNKVKKSDVIGDPPVILEKRVEGDPVRDDKFIFVMTPDKEDYPLPEGAKGTFEKVVYGEEETEIGNIPFSKPGVYGYTIAEKEDPSLDYEFDKTEYRVTYTVTEEKDGTMSCVRDLRKKDSNAEKCVFTNVYTGKDAAPGSGNTDPNTKDKTKDKKQPKDITKTNSKDKTGKYPGTGDVTTAAGIFIVLIVATALLGLIYAIRKKLR